MDQYSYALAFTILSLLHFISFHFLVFTDEEVVALLKTLSPSEIDVELRSLSPLGGGSTEAMKHFIIFLHKSLITNSDFELIQAYTALFTKVSL